MRAMALAVLTWRPTCRCSLADSLVALRGSSRPVSVTKEARNWALRKSAVFSTVARGMAAAPVRVGRDDSDLGPL